MDVIDALLMGLLQGLTEYLPVSSSGHLAIASHFFGIEGEANLTFTVAVHVATVFSTLVILWKDIVWIFKGLFDFKGPGMNESQRYALNILVSMIPVGIVGVFFKDYVEMIFGSGLLIVGICLLLTALLLTFHTMPAHVRKKTYLFVTPSSSGFPRLVPCCPACPVPVRPSLRACCWETTKPSWPSFLS